MKTEGNNKFSPPWWLKSRHLQSVYSKVFCYKSSVVLSWEELTLPDGDFIDLVWAGPEAAPIVILLHGLEGSADSSYIQASIEALVAENWRVVVMHYRSCSGRMNRFAKTYNAGDTEDFCYLLEVLKQRYPDDSFSLVGFSLGGNIILHYLAKSNDERIRRAVAVSTPYEMGKSADYLAGFYQRMLLRSMKQKVAQPVI